MSKPWVVATGIVLATATLSLAAPPPPGKPKPKITLDPSALGEVAANLNDTEKLAASLKTVLLKSLPDPLFEDTSHWGKQKRGPAGKMRNNGRWYKVKMTGRNLPTTLQVTISDLQQPKKGQTLFTIHTSFDSAILLERQTWKLGAKLYSGSTRARFRVKLALQCEVTSKAVKVPGSWIPDLAIRMHVVKAFLVYDNVVVEHTAGVGGDAAKVIGDTLLALLRQWKPSLERKMIEKATAAIVKSGDTKEVKVNLSKLVK